MAYHGMTQEEALERIRALRGIGTSETSRSSQRRPRREKTKVQRDRAVNNDHRTRASGPSSNIEEASRTNVTASPQHTTPESRVIAEASSSTATADPQHTTPKPGDIQELSHEGATNVCGDTEPVCAACVRVARIRLNVGALNALVSAHQEELKVIMADHGNQLAENCELARELRAAVSTLRQLGRQEAAPVPVSFTEGLAELRDLCRQILAGFHGASPDRSAQHDEQLARVLEVYVGIEGRVDKIEISLQHLLRTITKMSNDHMASRAILDAMSTGTPRDSRRSSVERQESPGLGGFVPVVESRQQSPGLRTPDFDAVIEEVFHSSPQRAAGTSSEDHSEDLERPSVARNATRASYSWQNNVIPSGLRIDTRRTALEEGPAAVAIDEVVPGDEQHLPVSGKGKRAILPGMVKANDTPQAYAAKRALPAKQMPSDKIDEVLNRAWSGATNQFQALQQMAAPFSLPGFQFSLRPQSSSPYRASRIEYRKADTETATRAESSQQPKAQLAELSEGGRSPSSAEQEDVHVDADLHVQRGATETETGGSRRKSQKVSRAEREAQLRQTSSPSGY